MQETASSSGRDTSGAGAHGDPSRAGVDFPVMLFDGQCLLCDRSVRFILERDRDERFHFAPLQSALGRQLLERSGLPVQDVPESMVLIEDGVAHTKSSAALRVAGRLPFPWKAAALFLVIPKLIRDAVYGIIARNRYRWFGKRESCMVPDPRWKDRFHE